MLFDVIIRLLAAAGLLAIVNASGITTSSVVVSICIFLIMELSLLFNDKRVSVGLTVIPFIIAFASIADKQYLGLKALAIVILGSFTALTIVMYEIMMKYKTLLFRTRDDSKELEEMLEEKNKRLMSEQDQQVHLATLAERNRIAREIHDNVGHLLSRAILLLGAIKTVNKDETIGPQLEMLAGTLDESMEKMRSSVHDLHDDSIDLKKNFDEIIAELKNFKVSTDLDIDESIPTNIKLSLIGILKEAVTNILKHSKADTVSIILQRNYSFCSLSVTDNGKLTQAEKDKLASGIIDGIGLENIRNRARSLGGDAYFYTNDGFTVFSRLPLNETVRG